jgi:hypothetical protein
MMKPPAPVVCTAHRPIPGSAHGVSEGGQPKEGATESSDTPLAARARQSLGPGASTPENATGAPRAGCTYLWEPTGSYKKGENALKRA